MTDRGTEIERVVLIVARALAKSHGLGDHMPNLKPWMRDARLATKTVLEAMSSEDEVRRLDEIRYHAEQAALYLALPKISDRNLASARWHNNKIRAALSALTPNPCGQGDGGVSDPNPQLTDLATAAISAMSSEDEVRRLREALTFYAAESNYKAGRTFMKRPLIPVMADGGETARTALTPNPCWQGEDQCQTSRIRS